MKQNRKFLILGITGGAGSGKTTLLRCLNLLEKADEGTVAIDGETVIDAALGDRYTDKEIREKRLHMGLVFQQFNLFPHMTVLDNLTCAPLMLKKMTREEEKVLITGDLDVQLERQGQARELGYFSAGQTDAVMLCMRLALVDALFAGEKPFVILDDPFVNLDDEHTAQALELLQTLAQERQIIYLVCNSSRTI